MSAAKRRARWGAGLLAAALVALAGCAADSEAPQDIFRVEGPNAQKIADLNFVYYLAAAVALLVFAVIAVVLWKFRQRHGDEHVPRQLHGNPKLEVMWTIVPAVLLAVIAVPTVITIFDLAESEPAGSLEITVVGQQWWWEFDYPQLKDANGQVLVTSGEMVIPAGKPVQLSITSRDVIHSFWVPRLNGKRDAVPNRVQPLRMGADEPGEYWGQCTEFCGLSHANMRIRVVALSEADWERWVTNQLQAGATPVTDTEKAGQAQFLAQCARCHQVNGLETAEGEPAIPKTADYVVAGAAPNLTHLMSRTTFAGVSFDLKKPNCENPPAYTDRFVTGTSDDCLNRPELERWLRNAPAMKPMDVTPQEDDRIRGMPALGLTESQIDELVAYLSTLK